MDIKDALRMVISKTGVTRYQMAQKMGVNACTVYSLLGRQKSQHNLFKLLGALGANIVIGNIRLVLRLSDSEPRTLDVSLSERDGSWFKGER